MNVNANGENDVNDASGGGVWTFWTSQLFSSYPLSSISSLGPAAANLWSLRFHSLLKNFFFFFYFFYTTVYFFNIISIGIV